LTARPSQLQCAHFKSCYFNTYLIEPLFFSHDLLYQAAANEIFSYLGGHMEHYSAKRSMNILINLGSLLLCEALGSLLGNEPEGYQVLATNAAEKTGNFLPDKIVVDACTISQCMSSRWSDAKIILLDTGLEEDVIINLLLSYKLDGVIKTDSDLSLFKKALKAIDAGQVWVDNSRIRALLNHAESLVNTQPDNTLSKKEREIIILISQGRKNREIADRLCISEQTVKSHISRIFRKTNVNSRSQLVPLALKLKLPEMY
jgi:DNA-binding NarL/FixJ family response regulator